MQLLWVYPRLILERPMAHTGCTSQPVCQTSDIPLSTNAARHSNEQAPQHEAIPTVDSEYEISKTHHSEKAPFNPTAAPSSEKHEPENQEHQRLNKHVNPAA